MKMQGPPEDIKSRLILRAEKIKEKICEGLKGSRGFQKYTGISAPLGDSSVYNTRLAANQMEFALALSQHPLIETIIRDGGMTPRTFDAEPLVDAKVLAGMKILDLGCGYIPSFARCSRVLGADVYTVDIFFTGEDFRITDRRFLGDQENIELRNHISIDLQGPDAVKIIMERTGGQFDLVTEAHLKTDGCFEGENIAIQLLKEGGIYFDAGGKWKSRVFIR